MNKVVNRFDKMMIISICSMIVEVVVGLLLLFLGDKFKANTIAVLLGTMLFVRGLFDIIKYIYDGIGNKVFVGSLFTGIVSSIIGVFICFYPTLVEFPTYKTLGILYGIYLIVKFVEKEFYGIKFLKSKEEIYALVCMTGILMLIGGLFIIINPLHSFVVYTIGMFSVALAVLEVNYDMLLRKRAKYIIKLFDKKAK